MAYHIMNYDEMIVFVIRETGWSLEYVREMAIDDLVPLVRELRFQKAQENYQVAHNFALALSCWANTISKKRSYVPEQFIGKIPTREEYFKEETSDQKKTKAPGPEAQIGQVNTV